jgi:hypothetical protein
MLVSIRSCTKNHENTLPDGEPLHIEVYLKSESFCHSLGEARFSITFEKICILSFSPLSLSLLHTHTHTHTQHTHKKL